VKATKAERVEHANALIRVIASHGRRFFYYEKGDRYARMELDAGGRVWFVDDYSEKRVYTQQRAYNRWRGFTHGGTMRSLVECLRDYITRGEKVPCWRIATPQLGDSPDDIWGYGPDAAAAVREAAFALPIMARDPKAPREFYIVSNKHTRREHRYVTLWRPDDKGYTFRASTAGRYTEERVREHLGYYNSGCSIAVPCDIVDDLTISTTPADCLDGTDGPAVLNTLAKWKVLLANTIEPPQYAPKPECKGAPRSKEAA